MASPEVLDFDRLLAPISAQNPRGRNLREDSSPTSPYYAVRTARSNARAQERMDVLEESAASLDAWRPVAEVARQIIAEQSKDLEVAAWLIEALVRLDGFAGLRDGFRLVRQLAEGFWEDLYPLPDEEGLLTKVAPLTGLNGDDGEGTLLVPIRKVPLTQSSEEGTFAQWHYQQALSLQAKASAEERKRGATLLEQVKRSAAQTQVPFFIDLSEDLGGCQGEFSRLCSLPMSHFPRAC